MTAASADLAEAAASRRDMRESVFRLDDLVADIAADGCAAHGAQRAAARQYRTGDGAATGADHGVLFPIGHAGTRCQTECGNGGCCNERDAIHCFHLFTSSVKVDRCSCKYG